MFNQYGSLATIVYELTKPVGTSLNGDIDYYSERLSGVTGKILEVGVGTGRMLLPLLEEGFDMEGVDNSNDMLACCHQNLDKYGLTANIYEEDLANFFASEDYFEAIIIPTATFCLFETAELATQVLTNLFKQLKPDGRLILDLDLPFYPELGENSTNTYQLSETEMITYEKKIIEIDWLEQHIISHLTYSKWENGMLIKTELQQLLVRWYGINEFKLLLEKIGFKHITVSADYDYLTTPEDSNQSITFEAKK